MNIQGITTKYIWIIFLTYAPPPIFLLAPPIVFLAADTVTVLLFNLVVAAVDGTRRDNVRAILEVVAANII